MNNAHKSNLWRLKVPAPWRIESADEFVVVSQPEGVGMLHLSAVRMAKCVTEEVLMHSAEYDLPESADITRVTCGKFAGFVGAYVDWNADTYWKKWWLGCGNAMLQVTYHCSSGDVEYELAQAEELLDGLDVGGAAVGGMTNDE